jgi:hypothetical protein
MLLPCTSFCCAGSAKPCTAGGLHSCVMCAVFQMCIMQLLVGLSLPWLQCLGSIVVASPTLYRSSSAQIFPRSELFLRG